MPQRPGGRAPAERARRALARPVRSGRRLEAWLLTGPVGHLLGGSLDFAEALLTYLRMRRRRR